MRRATPSHVAAPRFYHLSNDVRAELDHHEEELTGASGVPTLWRGSQLVVIKQIIRKFKN